jgi:hypothetical protein
MRTSLEVINRSAILLHIPDDHGNRESFSRSRWAVGHN